MSVSLCIHTQQTHEGYVRIDYIESLLNDPNYNVKPWLGFHIMSNIVALCAETTQYKPKHSWTNTLFLAATKQLQEHIFLSFRLSVRPSVTP